MLTEAQLRVFLPGLNEVPRWTTALNTACDRFQITAPVRLAAFLAQTAHESRGFTWLVENLNYSPTGLMKTWPTRFPTIEKAKAYARQPEKIANYVYANRLGNGTVDSGDGWRFRGRGILQITGRLNYRVIGVALQIPLEAEPERLEQPDAAVMSASHFWHAKGLNLLADLNTPESFIAITRKINGGTIGLEDRRKHWARAKAALA